MKPLTNYPIRVLATGIVVLILLSIPLFWLRFVCQFFLPGRIPPDARTVSIQSSGTLPYQTEHDPNVVQHSMATAGLKKDMLFFCLGCIDYFQANSPGGCRSNVFFVDSDKEWMYFDKQSGRLIYRHIDKQTMPDNSKFQTEVQLYIGPEGMSEIQDESLGRFINPIADRRWLGRNLLHLGELILYDKKLHRFFKIDFNRKTVAKGPETNKNYYEVHNPIQIGRLSKNLPLLDYLYWTPPKIEDPNKNIKRPYDSKPALKSIIDFTHSYDAGQYMLVLDESGRIDLLDEEMLKFIERTVWVPGIDKQILSSIEKSGWLPAPETFFHSMNIYSAPRDLLGYDVLPISFENYSSYKGMFTVSLSRDGTAITLDCFDARGNRVGWQEGTEVTKQIGHLSKTKLRSAKAAFFEAPWGPVIAIGKFVAENLHPPILLVASYFTAWSFEAGTGHRALFLLPNSFVAMKNRQNLWKINTADKLLHALLLMLPSIILGIWLASRVVRDANIVALSGKAKVFWIIASIAFGPAGYITYRFTRPKVILITCANCGKLRRPDMDICHHCGSEWNIPELTPPEWRVLDKERFAERNEPCTDYSL